MLGEELYEKCEEFFELIAEEYLTEEAEEIIENLREYLLNDIDGGTRCDRRFLAEEVEDQINALWNLLPIEERETNNNLADYYTDIIETTSEVIDGTVLVSIDDRYADENDDEEEVYVCRGHVQRIKTEGDDEEEYP
jgi:hypothetical protein